ncbi:MAG: hybrid sensor histidine kinase/response regulator [Anaerolineae bacterium]|nr:hybrid sensor histidine kinase/response regulator [Anaerolineae bacterium]MCO6444992.1 hybrid sensor histidine kinase/response regulator [Anaerolineae bacterium]
MTPIHVLILDESAEDALLLQSELQRAGYVPSAVVVRTEAEFVKHLNPAVDAIFADVETPEFSAERAFDRVQEGAFDIPFIVVHGPGSEPASAELVERGAAAYVAKDHLDGLGIVVNRALADRENRRAQMLTARELALSEQRFRRMFEVSLDVILMIDAADGTVLDANPAATIALGYPLADLIGGSWSRLFNKRYPPYANDVRSAAAGGGTVVLTHRFRHANGRFVPMDLTAILLEPGDETRSGRLLVTLRDISERLRADMQREEAQHLRGQFERERLLNDQRQQFLNFAVHEFKNPLSAIRSSNAMLQEYGERMTELTRQRHYQTIEAEVQRMLELINDMLTLGKLNAGVAAIDLQPLDLEATIRSVLEEMQGIHSDQTFTLTIQPGVYMMNADAKMIWQALFNLLSNAARYSPDHLTILVDLRHEDDSIILTITDQGIGVPPQDLPMLFDPFKRGSNVGSIAGTGLGLSIVKQSVELHGGTIGVQSELGVGTTFRIRLPAAMAR